MRRESSDPSLRAALQEAAARPDNEIDLTDPDAPEVRDWSGAKRGVFYRLARRPNRDEAARSEKSSTNDGSGPQPTELDAVTAEAK